MKGSNSCNTLAAIQFIHFINKKKLLNLYMFENSLHKILISFKTCRISKDLMSFNLKDEQKKDEL